MNKLFFWKNWYKNDRFFFLTFLYTAIGSFIYLIYCLFTGVDNVINWGVIDKLEQLKTVVDSFVIGNIRFDIYLDNYVIFQYFEGLNLTINPIHGYIFLVILVLMINLIMSILPSLSKFWFYGGMGAFIGFMLLLNLSQLELFNQTDQSALIITLGLYLIAGYYFREFNPYQSLWMKYLVFTLISAAIGILIYFYSGVEKPFLYIANYGIYGPVIITILFILSIAHEIIYGFLYLVSGANTSSSKNSLTHFVIISVIYITYVTLTFLYYTRQISWNLVYLNPFLIFLIAVIIGLWSFKKRESLFSGIFSFNPEGALFYIAFATISIITISYTFAMGNDPMIEAFEDAILYSQLGFGIMFFIYVIANFGILLARNYQVIKIVYQSRIFPFFVFRLGGIIAFGFIFFQSGFFPYYQTIAGYYNNIGDLFLIENQLKLAEEYYQKAGDYEYQNHRSNYAIASLARLQNNKVDEAYYFENSILKRPTEYAYVNLGNVYLNNDQYFEGLFKLKEGEKEFPYSHQILNNLGYFYSKTDITDSALYYFNLANNAARNPDVPVVNIFGALAKDEIFITPDSLDQYYKPGKDISIQVNRLGLKNQLQLFDTGTTISFPDSIRDVKDFAYLYNAGLNIQKTQDTTYFKSMEALAGTSGNEFYRNRLGVLIALHDHFIHKNASAIQSLQRLGKAALYDDEYFRILGKISLKLNRPRLALEFFNKTDIQNNANDKLNLSFALLEAGDLQKAIDLFNQLTASANRDVSQVAREYLMVLEETEEMNPDDVSDEFKYLLFRYHPDYQDEKAMQKLKTTIKNKEIKLLISTEYLGRLIKQDSLQKALMLYDSLKSTDTGDRISGKIQQLGYEIEYKLPDSISVIEDNRDLPLNHSLYLYDLLYKSLNKLQKNDTSGLDNSFKIVGTWDPFFIQGITKAVDYFYDVKGEDYYAYNFLLDAIDVNPYSVELNKKFVILCVNMNLNDYAEEGLRKLENLMSPEDFVEFSTVIRNSLDEKREIETWFR